MLTLFLIAFVAVCVVLYRSIISLLSQVPNGNHDFNAFLSDDRMGHASSSSQQLTKPNAAANK